MINLNICLSDIPKDRITTGKNGKHYTNITVDNLKEVDDKGNTHNAYMQLSKEERQAKVKKTYIGRGKEFVFNNQNTTNTPQASYQPSANNSNSFIEDDGTLPF